VMERIALVTGSTNNIGRAIAEVLSREGCHVIITSRNESEAKLVSHLTKGPWGIYSTGRNDKKKVEITIVKSLSFQRRRESSKINTILFISFFPQSTFDLTQRKL
jgi:NAD(P)-dependent dehydrogenase (short-subunit alcohol dehydrogenase family)